MAETKWAVPENDVPWSLKGDQVWIEEGDRFIKVVVGGREFAADSRDAGLLGGRSCPQCKRGALPTNFKKCLDCGKDTYSLEASNGNFALSHFPYFTANGWPETSLNLNQLEERVEIQIPGGDWALVVAGNPRVLLALDSEHGRILRFDADDSWLPIARAAEPGMKPWQRAVIACENGIFFAVESQGVMFLPTPFVTGSKPIGSAAGIGSSNPAGGLCMLGRSAYLPAFVGGKLRLEGALVDANPSAAEFWDAVAVSDLTELEEEPFGSPYVNASADVFWSGRNTYIAVAKSEYGEDIAPRRFRWREGFKALPAARPFRSRRDGVVWQLGQTVSPNSGVPEFAFHSVSLNNKRCLCEPVEGPHLPFGEGSFRGDKRHDYPWGEAIVDYDPSSNDGVYIPIAVSGKGDSTRYLAARIEGRELLADLVHEQGTHAPCSARICSMGDFFGSLSQLNLTIDLTSPHDVSTVIYRDRLFMYSRCENKLFAWRISA